jgi:uncharacterized protein DUF6023
VTDDRARGAVLYAGAALLLAAGGAWWLQAKPRQPVDPAVARWMATAERLLPDTPDADAVESVELNVGLDREIDAPVDNGPHRLSVVCVGGSNSVARISLGLVDDSGRGLRCTGDEPPTSFEVSLAGHLRMNVSVAGSSPVVFRYSVVKIED